MPAPLFPFVVLDDDNTLLVKREKNCAAAIVAVTCVAHDKKFVVFFFARGISQIYQRLIVYRHANIYFYSFLFPPYFISIFSLSPSFRYRRRILPATVSTGQTWNWTHVLDSYGRILWDTTAKLILLLRKLGYKEKICFFLSASYILREGKKKIYYI